eukprot:5915515-Prymnesium_polylepis.2
MVYMRNFTSPSPPAHVLSSPVLLRIPIHGGHRTPVCRERSSGAVPLHMARSRWIGSAKQCVRCMGKCSAVQMRPSARAHVHTRIAAKRRAARLATEGVPLVETVLLFAKAPPTGKPFRMRARKPLVGPSSLVSAARCTLHLCCGCVRADSRACDVATTA